MPYRHVQTIGGRGGGPEQFAASLRGLCIAARDRLFAAGDSQVKLYAVDGKLRQRWNASRPVLSVGVAPDGLVYAGEEGQVEIFEPSGKSAGVWRENVGEATAIGFVRGAVLVADSKVRCIRRFDKTGRLLGEIGKAPGARGFLIPNGALDFAVDARGVIHAANPGKHRVERYSPEGERLGHVGRFDGLDPAGFAGCCNPTNVEVSASGRLFVTEKAEPRAKALNPDGTLGAVIATAAFDPGSKNMDIAVDSRGRVYVADTVKLHILVFEEAQP